jgi:hypothetical protein
VAQYIVSNAWLLNRTINEAVKRLRQAIKFLLNPKDLTVNSEAIKKDEDQTKFATGADVYLIKKAWINPASVKLLPSQLKYMSFANFKRPLLLRAV